MKMRKILLSLSVVVFFLGMSFYLHSADVIQKTTPDKIHLLPAKIDFAKSQAIMNLRTAEGVKRLLGKQVDLDGFYYEGSIPMVLDDIRRVQVDMVMPPDSYVPIIGRLKGVKNGDRISMKKVKLDRPTKSDPAYLHGEGTAVRLAPDTIYTMVQPSTYQFSILERFPYQIIPGVVALPKYYAVLIAGGANEANNHVRYWNDLKTMYTILRNAGYPAANIYVIYANGVGRDASMPVNFAASPANITNVFNQLAGKMRSGDTLYIMTNDHGGPSSLNLWYSTISAAAFAAEVNKVVNYDKMIVQMKQCYSGSFVPPLTGPRRTVMSSSSATELSWAHSSLNFGEFTYWYFAALTGNKPDGSGAVNADVNKDAKISILEAYNYARSHDTRPETPHFEDNGVAPAHIGPMPAGGDGTRSASIFLH